MSDASSPASKSIPGGNRPPPVRRSRHGRRHRRHRCRRRRRHALSGRDPGRHVAGARREAPSDTGRRRHRRRGGECVGGRFRWARARASAPTPSSSPRSRRGDRRRHPRETARQARKAERGGDDFLAYGTPTRCPIRSCALSKDCSTRSPSLSARVKTLEAGRGAEERRIDGRPPVDGRQERVS